LVERNILRNQTAETVDDRTVCYGLWCIRVAYCLSVEKVGKGRSNYAPYTSGPVPSKSKIASPFTASMVILSLIGLPSSI
jgi:hypothetical protein